MTTSNMKSETCDNGNCGETQSLIEAGNKFYYGFFIAAQGNRDFRRLTS